MYGELCEVWKLELDNAELQKLPADFYSRTADYLRRLREESRMLDKRTIKANLLKKEMQNAKRIVNELIQLRFQKMVGKMTKAEEVAHEALTVEEEQIYTRISPFAQAISSFAGEILRGHQPKLTIEQEHKRAVLRFLKDVPAIIGADMKAYGPFKAEDVAALPAQNAKILIRQGLAEKVEVA